jgi:HlyD family secretion protein
LIYETYISNLRKGNPMTTNSDTISAPKTRKLSTPHLSKKAIWIALSVLLIAVTGGFAYYKLTYASAQTTTETTLQTAVVRQGDLVIYASGTGTLVAADEVDLAFKTGGQVTEIPVEVGDQVEAGDLLAQVDDTDVQIAYDLAKRNLLELTSVAAVATAEQDLAQAQIDLDDAINHLEYLISAPVVYWETEIPKAEQAVEDAQAAVDTAPSDEKAQAALKKAQDYLDYAKAKLVGAWDSYENYYLPNNFTVKSVNRQTHQVTKYVAAPTKADIQEARAAVTYAQATLTEAGYLYDALTGKEVPEDATGAGLSELEQAQLDLKAAQADLDGTRIYAPFSGTVMSIDTRVGDTVSSSTAVVTLADLSQPYLEVYLDESDWVNINTDYNVDITFDILPDQTFSGIVTSVDPGLYTESSSSVVRALVKLTDVDETTFNLPLGTSAAVDVISGSAQNAILVPVEALHQTGDQYTVFVMENGKPTVRAVEVGIQDLVYAEIKSGLNAGDVVTTGVTETN